MRNNKAVPVCKHRDGAGTETGGALCVVRMDRHAPAGQTVCLSIDLRPPLGKILFPVSRVREKTASREVGIFCFS